MHKPKGKILPLPLGKMVVLICKDSRIGNKYANNTRIKFIHTSSFAHGSTVPVMPENCGLILIQAEVQRHMSELRKYSDEMEIVIYESYSDSELENWAEQAGKEPSFREQTFKAETIRESALRGVGKADVYVNGEECEVGVDSETEDLLVEAKKIMAENIVFRDPYDNESFLHYAKALVKAHPEIKISEFTEFLEKTKFAGKSYSNLSNLLFNARRAARESDELKEEVKKEKGSVKKVETELAPQKKESNVVSAVNGKMDNPLILKIGKGVMLSEYLRDLAKEAAIEAELLAQRSKELFEASKQFEIAEEMMGEMGEAFTKTYEGLQGIARLIKRPDSNKQ